MKERRPLGGLSSVFFFWQLSVSAQQTAFTAEPLDAAYSPACADAEDITA